MRGIRLAARWSVAALLFAGGVLSVAWWAAAHLRPPAPTPAPLAKVERFRRPPSRPRAVPVGLKGLLCFQCHNLVGQDAVHGDIRFSHQTHLLRGAHCHVCHPFGGHSEGVAPDMDVCMHCHDGQRADDRCRTCHSDMATIKPRSHGATYLRTHGAELSNRAECWSCHERAECDDCHRMTMPHGADWRETAHGKSASAEPGPCYRCHRQSYCNECHGMTMPHPAGYARTHGAFARADAKRCTTCHTVEACDDCHQAPLPHPTEWLSWHKTAGAENPAACRRCHEQAYCDDCHQITVPHEDEWLGEHGTHSTELGAACARCHPDVYCTSCHKGTAPASHVEGFMLKHADAAKPGKAVCILCHGMEFCTPCHADFKQSQP